MNKKHALLAIAGLIVLTGCESKIMDDRVYVPSGNGSGQYDDFGSEGKTFGVPAAENAPDSTPDIAARSVDGTAPAPAPAPGEGNYGRGGYAPMENVQSSGGVTSDGKKSSGKGKKSGKTVSAKGGTYIVKSGDTLGSIARKHGVKLTALLNANNMTMKDAKKLHVGRKLVIPGKGKSSASAAKGKKSASAQNVSAEKGIYIVQKGDFPQKIARRNKVKLADLLKANNLTMQSARRLQIGQKLIIPGAGAAAKAVAEEKQEAPVQTEKKNDVPADRRQVDAADDVAARIENENNAAASAANNNAAPAGNAATAATDPIEITEDTTFKALAEKYGTTEENLRNLNENITGDIITKGNFVLVPAQK